jgi:hypothetical protein
MQASGVHSHSSFLGGTPKAGRGRVELVVEGVGAGCGQGWDGGLEGGREIICWSGEFREGGRTYSVGGDVVWAVFLAERFAGVEASA